MGKYAILEANMPRLEKKLITIQAKCKAFGCDFHYTQIGEEFRDLKDDDGNVYTARFVIVDADGTAQLNGWRFIASVEHTEKGNIINRVDDSIEVPDRYYSGPAYCEHCMTNRSRRDTYIVQNTETGEFKQVGKSCLRDFTHGLSADAVSKYLSYFEELVEGEAPYDGCHIEHYYDIRDILCYTAETIRKFGYIRRTDDGWCTADRAFTYFRIEHGLYHPLDERKIQKEMDEVGFSADRTENREYADKALAWIAEQEESTNYLHNLKTVCAMKYTTTKNLGILASLFPTYDKDLERQAEQRERERREAFAVKQSCHVGSVGDRVSFKAADSRCMASWDTDFGITRLYRITDDLGNIYIWKTGKLLGDAPFTVTGTVKAHTSFNNVSETELTRCRIA